MLDGSTAIFLSIYWICGSNTLCSASSARQQEIFLRKKFSQEQIFASWRLIVKIAKISRYTVLETPCQDLTLTQGKLSGEPSQLSWDNIFFCNYRVTLVMISTTPTQKYLDTEAKFYCSKRSTSYVIANDLAI